MTIPTDDEINNHLQNPKRRLQIGLIIAIIGIALIIIATTQKFTKTVASDTAFGFTLTDKVENKTAKNMFLYSGIAALVIGGVIFALSFTNNENKTLVEKSETQAQGQKNEDVFIRIQKLNELREKGIITEDEFNNKKKELLSKL
jgi:hypothetical protein